MRIYSIFNSIDGEVNSFGQGTFSTFIRFAGCNLQGGSKCEYCDTEYAQESKIEQEMGYDQVMQEIEKIGCRKITITGGEPLLQREFWLIAEGLDIKGYQVTVETNGTIPIDNIHAADCWIMDYKLHPHKEKVKHFLFHALRRQDFVKFVIRNRGNYIDAKKAMERLLMEGVKAQFAMSPAFDSLNAMPGKEGEQLIKWMQKDKLFHVKLNVQIHKLLGLVEDF